MQPTILIVDDSRTELMYFRELIQRRFDVSVECRQTCADGINAVKQLSLALLVLDGVLPDGHGSKIVKFIRRKGETWPTHRLVPIAVYTDAGVEYCKFNFAGPSQPIQYCSKPAGEDLFRFVGKYIPAL